MRKEVLWGLAACGGAFLWLTATPARMAAG